MYSGDPSGCRSFAFDERFQTFLYNMSNLINNIEEMAKHSI